MSPRIRQYFNYAWGNLEKTHGFGQAADWIDVEPLDDGRL